MRHGSLGNGGERNELHKMRSDVARGSRILRLVRNAPERDRPPPAPGGTGREQGARRRHHGARPRGERTPADVQQSGGDRSEEHTSELQSLAYLVCRLLLEKKKLKQTTIMIIST